MKFTSRAMSATTNANASPSFSPVLRGRHSVLSFTGVILWRRSIPSPNRPALNKTPPRSCLICTPPVIVPSCAGFWWFAFGRFAFGNVGVPTPSAVGSSKSCRCSSTQGRERGFAEPYETAMPIRPTLAPAYQRISPFASTFCGKRQTPAA